MRPIKHTRKLSNVIANDSGETMVETLVSILISSLALLMLATAIGTSVNIIMRSRESMEAFYDGESAMIESSQDSSSGSTLDITTDVALTRDDEGKLETTETVKNFASSDPKSNVSMYERSTP